MLLLQLSWKIKFSIGSYIQTHKFTYLETHISPTCCHCIIAQKFLSASSEIICHSLKTKDLRCRCILDCKTSIRFEVSLEDVTVSTKGVYELVSITASRATNYGEGTMHPQTARVYVRKCIRSIRWTDAKTWVYWENWLSSLCYCLCRVYVPSVVLEINKIGKCLLYTTFESFASKSLDRSFLQMSLCRNGKLHASLKHFLWVSLFTLPAWKPEILTYLF